jgi:hypothetical protein
MILFGIVVIIIGVFVNVPVVLWSLGVIALIIGLVLWPLGTPRHAVGAHRRYY